MKDEKMAEEYCNHLQSEMLAYTPENPRQQRTVTLLDVEEAFLAGLKAGRPQWHKVADGDYPKNESKVLCILGDFENVNVEVGYYSQVEGDSKRWRFEDYDLPDDSEEDWGVSAWKEIVLPKESE